MNQIPVHDSLLTNENGQKYLSRDGKLLCSPRDPQREAREWLVRQKINYYDRKALVLGIGAGYHVVELEKSFPDLEIDLFDYVFPYYFTTSLQILNETEIYGASYDVILAFRPSWANFENKYLRNYLQLTGRDQELTDLRLGNERIWHCLLELVK